MSDLKQLYRQAVVGRVAELEAALADSGNTTDAGEALRRIAHSLRGSGGTYGFPEVSTAAAAVEDAPADQLRNRATELHDILQRVIEGGPKAVRVLIIDDDPEILLLLRTVLARSGRSLTTAETAAEADIQLAQGPFTLIILDLLLPDADGRDVLKRIRAISEYATTPVLVLSAKTTSETRAECQALGATAFFEKPFDPEAVAAAVGAQLQRVADSEAESNA